MRDLSSLVSFSFEPSWFTINGLVIFDLHVGQEKENDPSSFKAINNSPHEPQIHTYSVKLDLKYRVYFKYFSKTLG